MCLLNPHTHSDLNACPQLVPLTVDSHYDFQVPTLFLALEAASAVRIIRLRFVRVFGAVRL